MNDFATRFWRGWFVVVGGLAMFWAFAATMYLSSFKLGGGNGCFSDELAIGESCYSYWWWPAPVVGFLGLLFLTLGLAAFRVPRRRPEDILRAGAGTWLFLSILGTAFLVPWIYAQIQAGKDPQPLIHIFGEDLLEHVVVARIGAALFVGFLAAFILFAVREWQRIAFNAVQRRVTAQDPPETPPRYGLPPGPPPTQPPPGPPPRHAPPPPPAGRLPSSGFSWGHDPGDRPRPRPIKAQRTDLERRKRPDHPPAPRRPW